MNIQSGKLYENRTWKYLYPCLNEHGDVLKKYLDSFFKLGVGVADFNNFSEEKISADILKTQVSEELTGQFLRGYPAEEKSYYEIKEINKPLFGRSSEAVKISRCETEAKDSWKKLENANPSTFEVNYEIRRIIPAGKYSSSGIPRISESYISNDGKNYYIDFYRVDEQLWRKIIAKYTNISENKK